MSSSTSTSHMEGTTVPPHLAVASGVPSAEAPSFLAWLPMELKCRMVSFLSPEDAVLFSERFPEHGVTMSRLQPDRRMFAQMCWNGDITTGDQPIHSSFRLPILKGPTHSVTLKCRWRDQGWGNRKGEIYIVASPKVQDNATPSGTDAGNIAASTSDLPFQGGRVVCRTSEIAPQMFEDHELSFSPRDGETYHLWIKPGGGGGHQLLLQDCKLHTVIFDDVECNWSHSYERLHELGVVGVEEQQQTRVSVRRIRLDLNRGAVDMEPEQDMIPARNSTRSTFYPKMLLRVCKSLRRQLEEAAQTQIANCVENSKKRSGGGGSSSRLDPELVEFMSEYEIPVTEVSLRVVEEIVLADMEERSSVWEESQRRETRSNNDNAARRRPDNRPDVPRMPPMMAAMLGGGGAMFGGVFGEDVPEDLGVMLEELHRQMNAAEHEPPAGEDRPQGNNREHQQQQGLAAIPFHEMMMQGAGLLPLPDFNIAAAMERFMNRNHGNDGEDEDDILMLD